jgi:hypothetical protein
MNTLSDILAALAKHADVIELLIQVLEGGADKASITQSLRASLIQASDDAMKAELGQP